MNSIHKSMQIFFFDDEPMFLYNYYTYEIIDVNKAALEKYGYSKSEFQRKRFIDLGRKINPDELDGIDKERFNPSAIWLHSDSEGKEFFVQYTSHLIHQNGHPAQFTIAHVVDSIIRSDKKNLALLPRIESVRAHLPMAMIEWDKNFKVRDWSDKATEIFGWEFEEVRGRNLFDIGLLPLKNRHVVEKQLSNFISNGKNYYSTESENRTEGGETIYCNWHNAAIYDPGRNLISIYSLVEDITDKRVAEIKLKESIESYKVLFNSIQDAMYILNEEGQFLEVNKGAERMYGYPREMFIGNTPDFMAAPGKVDMELTYSQMQYALNGEVQQFEWWGRKKSGEIFPKEVQLNPGTYFGKPVVIAIARDISERYEREQEVRHNEQLFRQLFQNAPVGIALLDKHKDVKLVNTAFEEIFGYKEEEIVEVSLDQIIVPEEKKREATDLSGSQISFDISTYRKRKDGNFVDVLIYGVPVKVDEKTIGIYGIYVDITERKKAEKKIKESLKEKEILLAEIHHRVKNNLAIITGLLELQAQNTVNEEAKMVLRDSQLRINSMALIHEKLYQSDNLSLIQFGKYIGELTDVISDSHITKEKPIKIEINSDLVEFTITQAIPCGLLMNEIVTNALKHAFKDRKNGTISISLKKKENIIQLVISDDGAGLPDNFEELKANSLGMTLIYTLANQLNAEMNIESERGTVYKLTFPLHQPNQIFNQKLM